MLTEIENEYIRFDKRVKFERNRITIDGREITEYEEAKKELKRQLVSATQEHGQRKYKSKKLHPGIWNLQHKDSWNWLRQNVDPRLVGLMIAMQEQVIPTRWYKKIQGLASIDTCRL